MHQLVCLYFSPPFPSQLVCVRGGGTLGVVVLGPHFRESFFMESRSNISSLKFSPDHRRLAVQTQVNSLVRLNKLLFIYYY